MRCVQCGLVLVLCVLCCAPCAIAKDERVTAKIGEITLFLPLLEDLDLQANAQRFPEINRYFETFVPPQNKLIQMYLDFDDITRFTVGEEMELDAYIMVQTSRGLVGYPVDRVIFSAIKKGVKEACESPARLEKKTQQFIHQAQIEFKEKYDSELAFQLTTTDSIGVVNEGADHLVVIRRNIGDAVLDGEQTSFDQVMGIVLARVAQKLIYFYVCKTYRNAADVVWVREVSDRIAHDLLAANPN